MADETAPHGAETAATEVAASEKQESTQETDWKAEARKWESRAKETGRLVMEGSSGWQARLP